MGISNEQILTRYTAQWNVKYSFEQKSNESLQRKNSETLYYGRFIKHDHGQWGTAGQTVSEEM